MKDRFTLEIIGVGTMGTAILKALSRERARLPIFVADRDRKRAARVARKYKVIHDFDGRYLKTVRCLLIAVKPQDLSSLTNLAFSRQAIIISIAAGVTVRRLAKLLGAEKVVRVMPNLGLSVGQGIAAWKSAGLTAADRRTVRWLLNLITENFEVQSENMIDAVTAISGSGPAYFFYFAQCLERAARDMGFNRAQARLLVERTFSGAAFLQAGKEYEDLVSQVASKGGTTEAALKVFESKQLAKLVTQAARTAYKRARELSYE